MGGRIEACANRPRRGRATALLCPRGDWALYPPG